ncbi:hypothetical protein HN51_006673 [Arachis hypogaea]|uniref:Uncharacterized protein LOC107487635 n=3 Tax=Arachis TaxID=3817 RepID=A0A6P4D800_ARADU|nr:uncharacterized protein LOC107487635 [Arachis duranensis]XP_020997763.1 uncharacterized protein LOC107487635 [Arachis duranensis]XP_025698613.1 uncharacterized protein LOC112800510 [Arachis hypogaea]QHO40647.1 uncharacterized protein DS421_5g138930 [Arachis hypogaea]RYQ80863.1 hypothetical protein Ahy_Scaffold1g106979 isoform A [Arachis hypogaea]
MEKKLIRPCDREYMRMAMLKHEQTFKQQVYELHRLYRIQQALMKNMEGSSSRISEIEESEIELTLGPSSHYNRKKVVEASPLTSDSGQSFSSSSGSGSGSCFIHNNTSFKTHQYHSSHREELGGGIIGLVQVPHSSSGVRNGYHIIEEQSRLERSKQPPSLLQVLSLSIT